MSMIIRDLGLQDYQHCYKAMQGFTAQRGIEQDNEVWLLEHPPVFTQGLAGKPEHVLSTGDIPVINTDRGGQVTYHGPGQLVVYLLMDLKAMQLGVKDYVKHLEQAIINFLSTFNIHAERKTGAPGVYVNNEKIAALGVRVRRGYTYHGIAININNDLSPFKQINPCGYAKQKVTSLKALGCNTDLHESKKVITQALLNEFNLGEETTHFINDTNSIQQWAA